MSFFVKYVSSGVTVVQELNDCTNRGMAVKLLDSYKEKADDNSVSLTSDPDRIDQWQKLIRLESEITPKRSREL